MFGISGCMMMSVQYRDLLIKNKKKKHQGWHKMSIFILFYFFLELLFLNCSATCYKEVEAAVLTS